MASSAAAQRKQNLLLGGCVCYAVLLSYAFRQFEMAQQITCDDEMPLVQRSESLLSEDVLAELLRAATTHTASNEGTSLNEGFAGSRGFVLRFNREGAQELVANVSHPFHFTQPFFERARDAHANAFVLNVLVIPPTKPASEARSGPATPAIGLHIDDTVGVTNRARHTNAFVAHSVSVL